MSEIHSFVRNAREKGVSDDDIRKSLASQGWEATLINTALLGLEVPKAPGASISHHAPSLSPLMTALQHVLLWFFSVSSAITITSVVASLSGLNVSAQVLASMIAVTFITFTPYAILFLLFVVKQRRTPELTPGKVWSIITICLHSIGAMIAGITLVVALIVGGEYSVWLSALLILLMYLAVIVTYALAAFGTHLLRVRRVVIVAYLPALLLLFGTLFIMSLLQLGPARHDDQVRKDLVRSTQAIRTYTREHNALPQSGDNIVKSSEIRYKKISSTKYTLCADFQANTRRPTYEAYGLESLNDAYTYEEQFEAYGAGEHCFTLTSSVLEENQKPSFY